MLAAISKVIVQIFAIFLEENPDTNTSSKSCCPEDKGIM